MKAIHKLGVGALALATFATACTKDFTDINTNPEVSENITPQLLLTATQKAMVERDFDWFYDYYQYIMRYMQYNVGYSDGNNQGMFNSPSANRFYSAFYGNVGRNLVEIEHIIDTMQGPDKARYASIAAIAKVHKVYSAWRVSDVNGSIPYTEALSARTGQNFTPKYDSQEQLFNIFDEELKAAINTLATSGEDHYSFGTSDVFYKGDKAKWARAANVLRLKIAMRLQKRNLEKTKAIVAEVLASPAGLFTANSDEWKWVSNLDFNMGGNWNAQGAASRGGKKIIDFMYDNADPRLPLFFKKNAMTEATFNRLKAGGAFPANAVYNPRQYVGLPESPDDRNNPAYVNLFGVKNYRIKEAGEDRNVAVDTLSEWQNRLFDTNADGDAAARYTAPFITYAEMCFIMAELSVKNIIAQNASDWYQKGIRASIDAYNTMASLALTVGYTPVVPADVDAYLAKPAIALSGTPEQQLEKIAIQQYFNAFKSPWEAWGYWKLSGYPKEGGLLNRTEFRANNTTQETPRRWVLPLAPLNQANRDAAIADMMKTGEYGNAPEAITGRVWWDKR